MLDATSRTNFAHRASTRLAALALVGFGFAGSVLAQDPLVCDGLPHTVGVGFSETFLIPMDAPDFLLVSTRGGQGGTATAEGCSSNGGKGATATAAYRIGTGTDELAPGGLLRFVTGTEGESDAVGILNGTAGGGDGYSGGGGGQGSQNGGGGGSFIDDDFSIAGLIQVTASTCNTPGFFLDTAVAVYTSCGVTSFDCSSNLNCAPPGQLTTSGSVTWTMQPGETHFIRVAQGELIFPLATGDDYVLDVSSIQLGSWTDIGSGFAGVTGEPILIGVGSLVVGSAGALTLVDAGPRAFRRLPRCTSSTPSTTQPP